jgi:hypothetical protein
MQLLPQISIVGATTCYPDAEFEGRTLVIRWPSLVFELTVARAERGCRVCGCTNTYACEGGCWWVEADLCSTCARRNAA